MPVKKCHKYGRKYYCYNSNDKTVSVFTEQLYQLNECPEEVIDNLINDKEDVWIIVKDHDTAVPLTKDEINQLLTAINNR